PGGLQVRVERVLRLAARGEVEHPSIEVQRDRSAGGILDLDRAGRFAEVEVAEDLREVVGGVVAAHRAALPQRRPSGVRLMAKPIYRALCEASTSTRCRRICAQSPCLSSFTSSRPLSWPPERPPRPSWPPALRRCTRGGSSRPGSPSSICLRPSR